ncbi:hypothetical protein MMC22_000456 [Lobaria immixta]|nr:hypothetical protein [Lobaria immixta]
MVVVDVKNVKATCDETLGTPNKADCPRTPWDFDLTGKVELKLENVPLINHVGRKLRDRDRFRGSKKSRMDCHQEPGTAPGGTKGATYRRDQHQYATKRE